MSNDMSVLNNMMPTPQIQRNLVLNLIVLKREQQPNTNFKFCAVMEEVIYIVKNMLVWVGFWYQWEKNEINHEDTETNDWSTNVFPDFCW